MAHLRQEFCLGSIGILGSQPRVLGQQCGVPLSFPVRVVKRKRQVGAEFGQQRPDFAVKE
jgi:hypothetical protein